MSTFPRSRQKRTVRPGPKHVVLGRDGEGAVHHWHRYQNTIHVVGDDLQHREQLPSVAAVERWLDYVDARRGWERCRYGSGLAGALADTLGGRS